MARILVIDDDASLREVVGFILTEAGHEVLLAGDGDAGVALFDAEQPDLVLTDMKMPGREGLAVLRHVKGADGQGPTPVVVFSAYGTVEQAVEAMKRGAFHYVLKPFNRDELRLTIAQALRAGELAAENRGLRTLLRRSTARQALVYESAAMAAVAQRIRHAAPTEASVLVSGESGTGKELVARALHDLSPRWDKPFVPVNCGAIPAELMESELFGHARGAFTGAQQASEGRIRRAAGGTLFLDEIGELPLALQPKLLRVLDTHAVDPVGGDQSHEVDFRLVCATNRDLGAMVAAGAFREDLYYRIEIVHVHVPPLRERLDDVPPLWHHFSQLHAGREVATEPAVLARLAGRAWRGNVRELKNVNQRAVLLCGEGPITLRVLEETEGLAGPAALGVTTGAVGLTAGGHLAGELPAGGLSLPDLERELVVRALARCDGNKSRAADYLGIPRHVLIYRLQKYGIDAGRAPSPKEETE
jgi:two-component system NtrC family response regulator